MEPCTRGHWKQDPLIDYKFKALEADKWLCLKINNRYDIAGTADSKINKYLQYLVFPCKNTTQNNNKCAAQ